MYAAVDSHTLNSKFHLLVVYVLLLLYPRVTSVVIIRARYTYNTYIILYYVAKHGIYIVLENILASEEVRENRYLLRN